MRQAWMQGFRIQGFPTQGAILSAAALTAMFAFAIGSAQAGTEFGSAMVLGEAISTAPVKLADGLFSPQPADSSESVRQIRQQPAPHVPADMLTEPSEPFDSALPIPEPTSLALLAGLGGMMMLIHRMQIYFDHRVTK